MPIERAARALIKSESGYDDWDALGFELQEEVRANICAVLEALRDPSPAMLAAGEKFLRQQVGLGFEGGALEHAWHLMLDALLASRTNPTRH
ncbi:hypothetical protein WBP07_24625 [Novosphingobium sp. BL-8A]|uniref:hypothetical protein n=1 Tax=Novosphingobium sp. BL-8A TaxID=3127639 RepID=UPI003756C339